LILLEVKTGEGKGNYLISQDLIPFSPTILALYLEETHHNPLPLAAAAHLNRR
jgi:hypothetical protein